MCRSTHDAYTLTLPFDHQHHHYMLVLLHDVHVRTSVVAVRVNDAFAVPGH